MKRLISIFTMSIALFFNCTQSTVTVLSPGVGTEGYVFSIVDSLPLDSVKITLTEFKGTNLGSYNDYSFYSDSIGHFYGSALMGYTIKGNDTIGYAHQCKVIFSKQGYIDTSFTIYHDATPYENPKDNKIYLRKGN